MIEKNKEYIVDIIDNGFEGEGIAKIDGFTIFIPNAIKGEKVKILIIKVLLVVIIFGGLIYYLNSLNNASVTLNKDNEEYTLEGVTMKLKDNTLTKSGATIIITDNNEIKYTYEEYYKLEKRIDHIWYELKSKGDAVFNEMGYLVDDNNELEMNIDWSKTYGNLTSGKYRIVKRIYDGEYKYFSVEFDLQISLYL